MQIREYEEWMYLLKLIKAQEVHFLYFIITKTVNSEK